MKRHTVLSIATIFIVFAVSCPSVLGVGVLANLAPPSTDPMSFQWSEVSDLYADDLAGNFTEAGATAWIPERTVPGSEATNDPLSSTADQRSMPPEVVLTDVPELGTFILMGLGLVLGGIGLYVKLR
jgi:hypothetical protein